MSDTDESNPPQTPEGSPSEPPAGAAPATPPAPEGHAASDDDGDPRVAALSRENANFRRRLRELEAKAADDARAKMTEAERLAAEVADAKAALEQERAERARERAETRVIAEAARQRAIDPEAVWALVRDQAVTSGDEPDYAALVKATLKAKPYLVAPVQSGSAADPARSQGGDREETEEERRGRLRGSGASSMFDPKRARERGGGVRFRGPE